MTRQFRCIASCIAVVTTIGCAAGRPAPVPSPTDRDGRAELSAAIDSLVGASEFRNAHWGVLIVNPGTGETLYSRNAGKLFMPASNMKVVTGAVALATLGADFRFRTTFVASGVVRDSVLRGDLIVHGRGDPSLSDAMRRDAMLPMREIADSLAKRGIALIAGTIRPGDDVFPDAAYGYGWSWDDLAQPYSAGVDELLFNEGFTRITVRAGSVTGARVTATTTPIRSHPVLHIDAVTAPGAVAGGGTAGNAPRIMITRDTATGAAVVAGQLAPGDSFTTRRAYVDQRIAFLAALREALAERGIAISDSSTAAYPHRVDTLFVLHSPALREILPAFQKPSQNQIGEVLLKTLGLEGTGAGRADSGRAVVERTLVGWGAERDGFIVRDGSGLSRYNYLTPETLVRTLSGIRLDTAFSDFRDALPIAGVDGTIANRMKGTPAEGNARAKTGFIAQARALSGYVTSADGETLIFSLLCNNWTVPVRDVERVQDAIVARLAGMRLAGPR
ncbi:MAG: D-alanyl-D-alanine carboxypeptidase/D-alanyl-D-alanine-endopeptidase [Gemmatimonadota bacterium]|nr:D-alanyl-D-alanine carboxypeptidase/D-alanyl-D-alanine-endopeptidase [Gemmatimonadota bacterium]